MKRIILLISILLLSNSICFAETKEIITESSYVSSDFESPNIAEQHAMEQAKRTAIEQTGTYIESYSQTKNYQLTKDEINTISSGIVRTFVLEEKREILSTNNIKFYIKIKCLVDTDSIIAEQKRLQEHVAVNQSQDNVKIIRIDNNKYNNNWVDDCYEAKRKWDEESARESSLYKQGSALVENGDFVNARICLESIAKESPYCYLPMFLTDAETASTEERIGRLESDSEGNIHKINKKILIARATFFYKLYLDCTKYLTNNNDNMFIPYNRSIAMEYLRKHGIKYPKE